MKIYYEKSLWDFGQECQGDIKEAIEKLEHLGKLDELESELSHEYNCGISDIDLRDLFIEDLDYLLSLIDMTEEEFFSREYKNN